METTCLNKRYVWKKKPPLRTMLWELATFIALNIILVILGWGICAIMAAIIMGAGQDLHAVPFYIPRDAMYFTSPVALAILLILIFCEARAGSYARQMCKGATNPRVSCERISLYRAIKILNTYDVNNYYEIKDKSVRVWACDDHLHVYIPSAKENEISDRLYYFSGYGTIMYRMLVADLRAEYGEEF